MKKVNWVFVFVLLIGFVAGGLIGTCFEGSFLNYGQTFGLNTPVELNLGFLLLTFGLQIRITICGIIGIVAALIVYRFIR